MEIKKAHKILDALSNPKRLRVFLILASGTFCVCELVQILDMKQAGISRMLKKLSQAGLLSIKKEGRWHIYTVSSEALNSDIVNGILKEINISRKDMNRIKKVKETGVRENCKR